MAPVAAPFTPYPPRDADWRFGDLVTRENGLRLLCWDCRHEATLTGAQLVERFGPERTVADIWPRLKCSACQVGRVYAYVVGVGTTRHPGPVIGR